MSENYLKLNYLKKMTMKMVHLWHPFNRSQGQNKKKQVKMLLRKIQIFLSGKKINKSVFWNGCHKWTIFKFIFLII